MTLLQVRALGRTGERLPDELDLPAHFDRLDSQAIFEVFEYEAADQRREPPRNSDVGGRHVALYVEDLDAAVAHLHRLGPDRTRRAHREHRPERGPVRRPASRGHRPADPLSAGPAG